MGDMGLAPSPGWGKGKLGLAMYPFRPAEREEEAGRLEVHIGSGHKAPTPVGRRGVGQGGNSVLPSYVGKRQGYWPQGHAHSDLPCASCLRSVERPAASESDSKVEVGRG